MTRSPKSAGSLLALSIIAGAVIGVAAGQPSAGVVIGAAVGVIIALAVWLADRR